MNRTAMIVLVVVVIAAAVGGFLWWQNNNSSGSSAVGSASASTSKSELCANIPAAATGLTNEGITSLVLEDTKEGSGLEANTGDTVQMHYVGRLVDGKQFDTSCTRGDTFEFQLGGGQVIQGWDSGILGMKVGGVRRMIIPANLAYGPSAQGEIPANSALVFDVELMGVTKP